jgi:hypothetical protein
LFEDIWLKRKNGIRFNLCNQKIVQLCIGSTSKEKSRWVKVWQQLKDNKRLKIEKWLYIWLQLWKREKMGSNSTCNKRKTNHQTWHNKFTMIGRKIY